MTANAFTEDKTKALKSGMDDYLTKPLESEKLIRALSRYKHN
jgi:CheY-like chemotaxis protein